MINKNRVVPREPHFPPPSLSREKTRNPRNEETRVRIENTFYRAAMNLLATDEVEPMRKHISSLLPSPGNRDIRARVAARRIHRLCSARFPNCLSLKLLQTYASNEPRFEDNVRESAIRRLNALLSHHIQGTEPFLDVLTLQELAPLLISCLEEQGIHEDTFKILAQVTCHVALETFIFHNDPWSSLRSFITSRAETEFRKAVYIFQSFSIPLEPNEFVTPLMENLLPPILKWLDPAKLHRENNWVLAFAGGFCAAVHLLGAIRADLVVNIAYKMLSSVTELVNRGMEVGYVRRAFRDVEMLVRKQSNWYCTEEYKFISGLIKRMKAVKGMKNGTKIVLWRIQMVMEKNVSKSNKKRDNGVDDWLNQC